MANYSQIREQLSDKDQIQGTIRKIWSKNEFKAVSKISGEFKEVLHIPFPIAKRPSKNLKSMLHNICQLKIGTSNNFQGIIPQKLDWECCWSVTETFKRDSTWSLGSCLCTRKNLRVRQTQESKSDVLKIKPCTEKHTAGKLRELVAWKKS